MKKYQIPFMDLHKQYIAINHEIDEAIKNVISTSSFIRGKYVDLFEEKFQEYFEVPYCISCANGTDALFIAMKSLDIKQSDEVIVPAHSWISTSETVTQAGGKVVFCDVDPDTFTIDPRKIQEKITSKTVGIIPVHLFGQPADMENIMQIADKNKLWVIEDCAQAHLARYKNKLVGTFGDIGTFSFYPGKNLGAMGDAGALVTNSEELQTKIKMYARHGGLKKGQHIIEGINSRMDGIQAAILTVKLKYIEEWTDKRILNASLYKKLINENSDLILPKVSDYAKHVWHLFVIKSSKRDELAKFLLERGIKTIINYPISLPFLEAYKYLNHSEKDFENAFKNQSLILSIPNFPELSKEEIEYIANSINIFNY